MEIATVPMKFQDTISRFFSCTASLKMVISRMKKGIRQITIMAIVLCIFSQLILVLQSSIFSSVLFWSFFWICTGSFWFCDSDYMGIIGWFIDFFNFYFICFLFNISITLIYLWINNILILIESEFDKKYFIYLFIFFFFSFFIMYIFPVYDLYIIIKYWLIFG